MCRVFKKKAFVSDATTESTRRGGAGDMLYPAAATAAREPFYVDCHQPTFVRRQGGGACNQDFSLHHQPYPLPSSQDLLSGHRPPAINGEWMFLNGGTVNARDRIPATASQLLDPKHLHHHPGEMELWGYGKKSSL